MDLVSSYCHNTIGSTGANYCKILMRVSNTIPEEELNEINERLLNKKHFD
jgi:hypothetical protein